MKPRIRRIIVKWEIDPYPDLSWLDPDCEGLTREELRQNAERLAQYHRGELWCEGCYAEAQTVGVNTIQTFTSGGLWGIESDTDDTYRREIERNELDALREELERYGVDVSEFDARILEEA